MAPNTFAELTDSQITGELLPYGISLPPNQIQRVRQYISLLLKWNRAVSLTTVISPTEIVGRHFGESMFLAKQLPVENCRLADVGSGAGFPGVALKIPFPNTQLVLIESNKKKCAFLAEVIRILEFSGVEVRCERFEEIRPESVSADLITCRALGGLSNLLRWANRALSPSGRIALWVGGEDSARIAKVHGWTWSPAIRIPNSQRRFLLIGTPAHPSGPENGSET